MNAIRLTLVLAAMMVFALVPAAMARPAGDAWLLAAQQNQPQSLIGQPPRISRQQAASMVKRQYSGDKILSVNLIESKGPPVYRVKVLSPDGVVKHVFVDGRSGDLFE